MRVRRILRRYVPLALRVRMRAERRSIADWRDGTRFARAKVAGEGFGHEWGGYSLVVRVFAGQEEFAAAKFENLRLMAAALDRVVVRPGETFSTWALAGEPTRRRGYLPAAALVDGVLTSGIGGATCLVSTVIYNAGLLAGLAVVERHAHSVDTYGDDRYFELGRDAAIEYAYLDLRFRNDGNEPLMLRCGLEGGWFVAAFFGHRPRPFEVDLAVSDPVRTPHETEIVRPGVRERPGYDGVRTTTIRTVRWDDGRERVDDLGASVHQPLTERRHA